MVSSRQASISFLQRRLRIGFSRAARLIDMMEADGLVSSGAGGKARDVLVPRDLLRRGRRALGWNGAEPMRTPSISGIASFARRWRVERGARRRVGRAGWCSRRDGAAAQARSRYERALARSGAASRSGRSRRRSPTCGAAWRPAKRSPVAIPPAATPTTRSGRPRTVALAAFRVYGSDVDRARASACWRGWCRDIRRARSGRRRPALLRTARAAHPRRRLRRTAKALPARPHDRGAATSRPGK